MAAQFIEVGMMNVKINNYLMNAIGLAFFVYGGVRLGVSSLLLMQAHGVLSFPDLQDGLIEVIQFMAMVQEQALLPLSPVGYLVYLSVMGSLLVLGAVGCLQKKSYGPKSIYVFLAFYALLFINFQVINPKVFHLIVCALMLAAYKWLRSMRDSV